MSTLLVVLHVIASVVIIVVVLMQKGKGADMGLTGSSESVLGTGGANFFLKVTAWTAALFMATGLVLTVVESRSVGKSLVDGANIPSLSDTVAPSSEAPVTPSDTKGSQN